MFRKTLLTVSLVAALLLVPGAVFAQEAPIVDTPIVDWLVEMWAEVATESEAISVNSPAFVDVARAVLNPDTIVAHSAPPQAATPATLNERELALLVTGLNAVVRYGLPLLDGADVGTSPLDFGADAAAPLTLE